MTQGTILRNLRTKYKRSKNVFAVTSIALSCGCIWARLLQPLALSLTMHSISSLAPQFFLSTRFASNLAQVVPRATFAPFPSEILKTRRSQPAQVGPTRVPALPMTDCARGCSNRAQMCPQLSAIDLTAKKKFERLFLVLGLRKIVP